MKHAVTVLGLLAAFSMHAQNHLKDFTLKRSLKQDGLQFNFTVLDDDKRGIIHYNDSKFYFWTKAQHVQSTQGASAGQLLHGSLEAFYPGKQLAFKGEYTRGLKHGTWMYWHKDGTFQRIEHWRRGKLCGKQQFFDQNGQLVRTDIVRGHKKKSVSPDTTIVWKLFDRKTVTLKDSLGQKSAVLNYKNNQLHGIKKVYVDGKLDRKVRYKKGELIEKKEGSDAENSNEKEEAAEKEPGKLKVLWNKLFSKDKESDVTEGDNSDKKSKESRKEKRKKKRLEKEQNEG